ncbi:MAG: hypothetical protein M1828_002692 [Chrysothrix sp. TS-e1954]|nr:MAG: hypothetical protein M1828_002692 [Chrysothrix sp. TS-e1954]
MCDSLLDLIRQTLAGSLPSLLADTLQQCETGDYRNVLTAEPVRLLVGHEDSEHTKDVKFDSSDAWDDYIFRRLGKILSGSSAGNAQDATTQTHAYLTHFFFLVAIAALQAYLQSNVTGPVLSFSSQDTLLPRSSESNPVDVSALRNRLVRSLSVDGEAAYGLIPNVELLSLADAILACPGIVKSVRSIPWARLRLNFVHQQLFNEASSTLQSSIYQDMRTVKTMLDELQSSLGVATLQNEFAIECAAVHVHHGFDNLAKEELRQVARRRRFEHALTGKLGKRTKYQEKDLSQLVVLARSHDEAQEGAHNASNERQTDTHSAKPENLDLNDDTLLESISFHEQPRIDSQVQQELPPALASLDPGNQPRLDPLDSTILLSLASSITNTSPADGLTREETMPYVTRVLDGGSSSWQIYTQALLLRSRIEGYKSRTTERGLLQLQALVDQVIAETGQSDGARNTTDDPTAFLPLPRPSESAPASERLRYIFQLNTPTRWVLEAELAARWVSLGGLRSALDIYERLEMWAEAALCWAATDREDRAKAIIRKQLFNATSGEGTSTQSEETWQGAPREPQPNDAPRLYCILGDFDSDPGMYEKAWKVSGRRYARAQRSLGRFYFSKDEFLQSASAYTKSLRVNQLNQSSWFALGCALLSLSDFDKAAEAFSRAVQLDESDAEAWSNLATSLLHKSRSLPISNVTEASSDAASFKLDDEAGDDVKGRSQGDVGKLKHEALKALKRAATLKYDSFRIWENLLTVAASVLPPSYVDMISAQRRIIELRGPTDGEQCVDVELVELLTSHVIATTEKVPGGQDGERDTDPSTQRQMRGLPRMLVDLVEKDITPLITSSTRLWKVVGKLALWRDHPGSALAAHEKAWRVATSQPGWEIGTEKQFDDVTESTIDLMDAYESLGERGKTEGMAQGSGELVAKDWRFKARSAARGVLGKSKGNWEHTDAYQRLSERLEDLRSGM